MMLEQTQESRSTRATYFVTRRQDRLREILEPGRNVGVWRRSVAPDLQRWLDERAETTTFDVSGTLTVGSPELPELADLLPSELRRTWQWDIARLVALFTKLAGRRRVSASVATVKTDKCRKFHTDYKSLRLVCTYSGPGTEWVDDRNVVRSEMGREESCFDLANARIVPTSSHIQRARPGDVVVLKGELFPQNRGRGAAHRSPPIARTGERRIVLTLDAD